VVKEPSTGPDGVAVGADSVLANLWRGLFSFGKGRYRWERK